MDFCHLQAIFPTNMEKKYWILLQKQDYAVKTAFKKVVHKTAEATGELIGNKITKKNCEAEACA